MALLDRVQADYNRFIQVVTQVIELIRRGSITEGRELQRAQASPLADRLERLTNELVSKAEGDMVARIEVSHDAYLTARWVVIGFAVGSIGLALVFGYAISWSLIGPVMDVQLPGEGAAAVLFLASPSASYVSGTILEVNGGR